MPIVVVCPKCSKKLSGPEGAAGRVGKCPGCGAAVPFVTPPPSPPSPPDPDLAGFDEIVAEETRGSKLIGAMEKVIRPPWLQSPPAATPAGPQRVIITRVSLSFENMVGLVLQFWFATLAAAIIIIAAVYVLMLLIRQGMQ